MSNALSWISNSVEDVGRKMELERIAGALAEGKSVNKILTEMEGE